MISVLHIFYSSMVVVSSFSTCKFQYATQTRSISCIDRILCSSSVMYYSYTNRICRICRHDDMEHFLLNSVHFVKKRYQLKIRVV